VIAAITFATLATASMSIGFSGWLREPLSWPTRLLYVVAAVLIAWPAAATDTSLFVVSARVLGVLVFAALLVKARLGAKEDRLKIAKA